MTNLRSLHLKISRLVLILVCLAVSSSFAATPQTITFQGRLTDTDGIALDDGAYIIRLAIYDSQSGGVALWDAGEQAVIVKGGLFAYSLGANVSFPSDLFASSQRFLGVTVGADSELTPRIPFRSVPYALESSHSDSSEIASVANSALNALQANTAQHADLADVALTANVALASDSAALADSAIVAANANNLAGLSPDFYLDWNSITNMPGGFADGTDDGASLTAGAGLQLVSGEFSIMPDGVTEPMLATDAVTAVKIAAGAVGSSEVENNSLTSTDLAANSVGSSEIADNSVTSVDLAAGSVGFAEIVGGVIDSSKIAQGSISGADIALNSITSGHIQDSSFSSAEFLDEPGVSQVTGAWFLTLPSLTTITSQTISAPSDGFVMAFANFEMKVTHVFGTASQAIVGLSNSSVTLPSDQNKNVDIPSGAGAGEYTQLASLQRIFPVSAGDNTFYLLGRKTTSSSPTWSTFDVTFSLVYFSTSYGTTPTNSPVSPNTPNSGK